MTFSDKLIAYIEHWEFPIKQRISYFFVIIGISIGFGSIALTNENMMKNFLIYYSLSYVIVGVVASIIVLIIGYDKEIRWMKQQIMINYEKFDNMSVRKRKCMVDNVDDIMYLNWRSVLKIKIKIKTKNKSNVTNNPKKIDQKRRKNFLNMMETDEKYFIIDSKMS